VQPRLLTPAFGLVVGATFAVFASFGMLVYALPLYARDALGTSDVGVGLAMGAASIGAIVVGPPSGRVADRRGRKAVLFAGAAGMLAGYLVLALEPSLAAVVPLRVVVGAAEAAFVVAVYTMAVDLAPEHRRGEAMSLVTVGSYAGLAGGPPLAGLLLGDDRFALVWLVAAALVAGAGALAFFVHETRSRQHGQAPAGWLPPRQALVPGLVLLFALIGFGGFNAFVVLYARELGVAHPGLVFIVFGAVVVAVRVLGRRLPDRLGPRVGASIACSAIAAGLLVIALWPSEAGLFLGAAIFAGGQALAYPAIVLLALSRSAPEERSAAVGAVAAFIDVALATGAFLLGIAAHTLGYRAVFAVGAVSAALGLLLLSRMVMSRGPLPAGA
jgi:predicted MFS family arabinose efflux permease